MDQAKIEDLKGKILTSVERIGDEEIIFITESGEKYRMFHWQNCCETVEIEDINGNLLDLVGEPLLIAEEIASYDAGNKYDDNDSYTWTFYRFATRKGSVAIRWFGTSNGGHGQHHYHESVDFYKQSDIELNNTNCSIFYRRTIYGIIK